MFRCEKSVRQSWRINLDNHTIELNTPSLYEADDVNSHRVRLCVSQGDVNRPILRLTDCQYWFVIFTEESN